MRKFAISVLSLLFFFVFTISWQESASMLSEAKAILRENSSRLKIKNPADWEIDRIQRVGSETHIQFRQMYQGFVVHGAAVTLHFDSHGRLFVITSKTPDVYGPLDLRSNRGDVESTLHAIYGPPARISLNGLVVLPFHPAKLAWSAVVEFEDRTRGAWGVFLDAADPRIVLSRGPLYLTFDGSASVWKENPVTTPVRVETKLAYLDGTTSLSGSLSKSYDANFAHDVSQPIALPDYTTAKNMSRRFVYGADDPRAVEAMAYHHITVVQDRYRSFGFAGFGARAPFFVNVAATDGGSGYDNAYYGVSPQFPKTGIYVFGAGDNYGNMAKDADVLYHEYSHGVLDKIAPGLNDSPLESVYGFAIHEAFADVGAAAINGNPKIAEFGFRSKITGAFDGRNLQNTRRFPQNVIWPAVKVSEPHYTSLILSGSWWDLQTTIGSTAAQQLFFKAAYLVPPDADFFDFRDAVLAADRSSGGKQQNAILQAFSKHGVTGPNPSLKGSIQIQRAIMRTSVEVKTDFARSDDIYFSLEYNATGISPGYFLVPEDIQFQQPAGSNARLVPNLPEIFNGQHTALNSSAVMQVITDASTLPGSYSISVKIRRGCTNKILGQYTTSFSLH